MLFITTGDKLVENVEDDHCMAGDFDFTEEVESPFSENQYENLVADTEELDIPNFADDLRALMVEDSEDELVVSDSDDDTIAEPKVGKTKGKLRRKTVIFTMPFEDHSLCISFCFMSFS